MVPWALVYAVNILCLLGFSFAGFYALPGGLKGLGAVPLVAATGLGVGHSIVVFFIVEQRQDLDIYTTQQAQGIVPPS